MRDQADAGVSEQRRRRGIWVAVYPDFSEMVPFEQEIEALRYAVASGGMAVLFVPQGVGIRKAAHAHWEGRDVPTPGDGEER